MRCDSRKRAVQEEGFEISFEVGLRKRMKQFFNAEGIEGVGEFASGKGLVGVVEKVEGGRCRDDNLESVFELVDEHFCGISDSGNLVAFVDKDDVVGGYEAFEVFEAFFVEHRNIVGIIAIEIDGLVFLIHFLLNVLDESSLAGLSGSDDDDGFSFEKVSGDFWGEKSVVHGDQSRWANLCDPILIFRQKDVEVKGGKYLEMFKKNGMVRVYPQ